MRSNHNVSSTWIASSLPAFLSLSILFRKQNTLWVGDGTEVLQPFVTIDLYEMTLTIIKILIMDEVNYLIYNYMVYFQNTYKQNFLCSSKIMLLYL
jgi:hypothetical protein